MKFLADKETNSKGVLLWIILITVGLFIIYNLVITFTNQDITQYYKEKFPIKGILTIISLSRIFILVSFVGLIKNVKESIIGIWIGYLFLTFFLAIAITGMQNEINGVDISNIKYINLITPILTLIVPIVITLLTKKIKENFKSIIQISNKNKGMKKTIFTIIGAILGLPLSYYFQPDMVQAKIGGIGGYIKNFGEILEEKDLVSNVIMGVVVFAVIGFVIGYFMDKNANQKTD